MTKGIVKKAGSMKNPVWFFETKHLNKAFVGESRARELILQGRKDLKREPL